MFPLSLHKRYQPCIQLNFNVQPRAPDDEVAAHGGHRNFAVVKTLHIFHAGERQFISTSNITLCGFCCMMDLSSIAISRTSLFMLAVLIQAMPSFPI
jgi:hypothetical protein